MSEGDPTFSQLFLLFSFLPNLPTFATISVPPSSEPAQGPAVLCASRVRLPEQQGSEQHSQLLPSHGAPALCPEGPASGQRPAA